MSKANQKHDPLAHMRSRIAEIAELKAKRRAEAEDGIDKANNALEHAKQIERNPTAYAVEDYLAASNENETLKKLEYYSMIISSIDDDVLITKDEYEGFRDDVKTARDEARDEFRAKALPLMEQLATARDEYAAKMAGVEDALDALDDAANVHIAFDSKDSGKRWGGTIPIMRYRRQGNLTDYGVYAARDETAPVSANLMVPAYAGAWRAVNTMRSVTVQPISNEG